MWQIHLQSDLSDLSDDVKDTPGRGSKTMWSFSRGLRDGRGAPWGCLVLQSDSLFGGAHIGSFVSVLC